ncbi:hemagglutinin repeat-containing protein [Burkholderia ubonensis]|uniref:Filamentous hemagglutinin N-terminal domain-containing protein n=1 Tax=Burkholderia ubonensis TaxID=101571 RepID=A0AB74D1H0_9BURK|nr:hemagglutinin repeat-containing protein [Burkholderia ubonensis]PAJ80118.1 hemagglutinin [Burkholderia ubonensis]PAJ85402.1 hemagglutinin [Burkholderia ubonensis]PAJ92859.1 hemagglutinin [Burkholderia ubonensis]PAJ99666.1 hemagglutinin [Burkholderia ubonensis]PAK06206.1 hemagglutinin [Burkholderia ubonensis]
MNKNRYRVVFNRARGAMMVVQENGNAPRAAGIARGSHASLESMGFRVVWHPIAMAAALLFGVPLLSVAQIAPTPGTNTHVIQTQNGLPQVNIAAPSGAGVSVNTYNQFDVQKNGALLNNSPTIVQTQQAGYINGNPNFGPGQSARIIVNQVNSANPSQLRGYVEVAGSRAEVVLANPSGIVVDGGGFINTSRATLTTGQPYYGADGSLGGFDVTRGLISVQGAGLNASNVDQVDLITRAVQANAAIYAKNLNVVAGVNQVNHDTLAATPIAGDGAAPAIAIDVSQLGGMYSNRILLVSNENGVGVANAGTIAAQAGDLTLQSNGQLVLTGKTTASGNLTATANSIQNTGTTYAQQSVNVSTSGALSNSGTLAAQQNTTINAGSIDSTGTLGAGVNDDGSVGKRGDLNVSSTGQLTATGQNVAGGNVSISGGAVNLSGSQTAANGNLSLNANAGDLNLSNATTSAQGAVNANAVGALINDHGSLSSGSNATLAAGRISNQGGKVSTQGPLTVQSSGQFDNQGGTLVSEDSMQVHGGALANNQGTIQSAGGMTVSGTSLDNSAGRVTSLNGDGLSITTTGQLINASGTTSTGAQGGVIGGNGGVNVQGGTVVNQGVITANTDLHVTGQSVDNSGGSLKAAQSATVDAGARLSNASGTIVGQSATVNGTTIDNSGGTVQATQVALNGTDLVNHSGVVTQTGTGPMAVNVSGTLDNSQGGTLHSTDLTLAPATLLNDGGTITHGGSGMLTVKPGNGTGAFSNVGGSVVTNGQAAVQAGSWNNAQGAFAARHGIVANIAGNLANSQGLIRSQAGMSLTSGGTLDNQNGKIAAGTDARPDTSTLNVQAASIQNSGGLIADFGTGATSVQGGSQLVNDTGTITGNGDVTAQASSIVNTNGAQLSGANVQVRSDMLVNTDSKIGNVADGNVDIATTGVMTNTNGQIGATHDLSVSASTLLGGGTYSAAHDVLLNLQGDFSSTPAYQFSAGHDLAFTLPGTFTNSAGLQSVNNLSIHAGDIVNSGAIAAGNLLKTHSNTLTNTGVMVGGSASLVADSTLSNIGPTALIGASDSNGTLELLSRDIENRDETTATDAMAQTAIYGLGKVVLAGGKDANGNYTHAALIRNQSALIQSGGDMELHADQVTNTRRVMTTTGYTNNVDPAWLQQLGISMSGCAAYFMDACNGAYDVPGIDLAKADPSVIEQLRKQIGGVFIDPPHEGQWNSRYQRTTYTGVATANTVKDISPAAQIVSGGKLGASSVGTLQNYWSNIAAVNGIEMPASYDADGWKASGQQAPSLTVTYSGHYHYNNYDNSEHDWTYSFCDQGCNGPADVKEFKIPDYQSTLVTNGALSGTGVSINNTAGNASIPSPGLVAGQSLPVNSGAVHGTTPTMVNPVIASATAINVLNNLTIAQGGLFKPTAAPNAPYVIETNPAFTDQKRFISSDYFFGQLGVDLTHIPKRLGDGFYEQQLVRNEITSLTGKAVLGPYTDTQSMYESLMAAGASLAKSLNLPLGMSLSPEQVSQLTRNVILMETRVVDGQSVLVPVVYLAKASQENWNGPLIGANDIDLKNAQTFTNSGTMKAANTLSVDGKQIDNAFGALQSGGLMKLTTTGDVDLTSANVKAGSLQLDAGKDLILDTATKTVKQVNDTGATRITTTLGPQAKIDVAGNAAIVTGGNFQQSAGDLSVGGNLGMQVGGNWNLGAQQTGEHKVVHRANGVSDVDVNQAAGSSVKVGGVSQIGVGGDLTAKGAQIDLGQGGTVAVKGDVSLGAASATSTIDSNSSSSSRGRSSAATLHAVNENVTGTTLKGGDTVNIVSGKDMTLSGSTISLDKGNANLLAAGDVNVGAVTETHEYRSHETHSRSGVLSGTKIASGIDQTTTISSGSTISADGVTVTSGRDINVTGSNIVGTNDVSLDATRNVNITTSQDTVQSSSYYQKQESGLLTNGGLSVTFGSRSMAQTDQSQQVTNNASVIGSSTGNVSINAGKNATVTGSTVVAGQDIALTGQNVTVNSAYDSYKDAQSQQFSQSGLSVGLGGGLVGLGQSMASTVRQGTQSGDSRLAAVQAVAAAEQAYQNRAGLKDAATALSNGNVSEAANGVQVQISIGSSHSSSNSTASITSAKNSSLIGNSNVSLTATGATDANGNPQAGTGDIAMTGANVLGKNISLDANNAIKLHSSQSTERDTSSNSSSGWNAGVAIGVGKNTGISVFANGTNSHGQGNGDSVTQINTTVTAGNTLTMRSGGDTTLTGAQVSGDKVKADIGGNLTTTSIQDTSSYASNQHSAGASGSFTFGYGGGADVSIGHTGIDANYASVNQQSGIVAGKGGFDVNVANHTQLNGAQIASAAPAESNALTTGSLGFSNVQNSMSYSASSEGFSTSSGPSFAQTSDHASGVTQAAVSPAKITVKSDQQYGTDSTAGLSRDTTSANQTVQNTFNLQQVQNDLAFAQAFGKAATFAVAEAATQLENSSPQMKALFGEGGAGRDALHAAVAAIGAALSGGNIGGAVAGSLAGDMLQSLAQPIIDQAVCQLPLDAQAAARNALNEVVAVAGGAAGGALTGGGSGTLAGAGAAANNELYNRRLHEDTKAKEQTLAKKLAAESGGKYAEQQIQEQMAQMDLVMSDGGMLPGNVRVASGDKPQDGTEWTQYGVNKAGQTVWTQSLGPGDPDLQTYIVKGAQGSGFSYQATTTGKNPGMFRLPDFVNFQVDYFVGSVWGTFSRDGNSYFGYGVNKALPNSVNAAASAQLGWLNQASVRPGQTNNFLSGYAGNGTGAFSAIGGGIVYSPGNGTATVIGIGAGANLGKTNNPASAGMGYTVDQGKTGVRW